MPGAYQLMIGPGNITPKQTEPLTALSEPRLTQLAEMLNSPMSQDLMFCDARLGHALEWLE